MAAEECESSQAKATHARADEEELAEELVEPNQVVARSADGTRFYLYTHQAGGHTPFLRSANGSVCKPVIALELQFYEALGRQFPQLRPFVPQFLGKVTVELSLPSSVAPSPVHTTCSPPSSSASSSPAEPTRAAKKMRTGSYGKKRRLVKPAPSSSLTAAMSADGYSAKLWKQERAKKSKRYPSSESSGGPVALTRSDSGNSKDYLMLGDLTRDFRRPCVLDIKMGTRQHGEDAPPAKVKSHSAKCAATTSLALGLRLCGMQIYDEREEGYAIWDKSWGRQLTASDIEPALETYLTNGSTLRWDALERLLRKVQQLRHVVGNTTGLRCWGSSLLLVYEGDRRHAMSSVDVRLIDFAHCQMSSSLETPDEGLLLGLTNIDRYLSNIVARRPPEAGAGASVASTTATLPLAI
ncbi:hypothetical protein BBJ28_00005063 [Nothophytophthora sp. Chile5]|nr:hypothetical protein BBJ28_00005063 [Nothophytophthora sp. Chile5]